MDSKAQVAFDYLVLLTFVIALVAGVSVIVIYIGNIASSMISEALNLRTALLQSLVH